MVSNILVKIRRCRKQKGALFAAFLLQVLFGSRLPRRHTKNKTSFLDQGPIFAKSEGGLQKLKCPKHFSLWDSFVNKCEGKKHSVKETKCLPRLTSSLT